jgi:hypothetical protein
MNRQKVVLCLLLLVLAGSLVYSFLRSPKERLASNVKPGPGSAATLAGRKTAAAPKTVATDNMVHLGLLDRELPRFSGFRRNIFSPIFREELKPPPFRPLAPPPLPVKALPPPPQPQPQAQPAPLPSPEQIAEQIADSELSKLTFLGFLQKNGEKTVFLSSNNEIFLAKKGSTLASKFQVIDLTDDALTIRSLVGGREVVIPLVENRSLSTHRSSTSKKNP